MVAPFATPPDHSTSRMASTPPPKPAVDGAPVFGTSVIFTVLAGSPNLVRKASMSDWAIGAVPTMPMVTPVPSSALPPIPGS